MAAEQQIELYRQRGALQEKITYFLLAAVGACIGFALTQTKGMALQWNQVPLAIGLAMWALSFLAGCSRIKATEAVLFSNMELVKVQDGQHPTTRQHPQAIQIASEELKANIGRSNTDAAFAARWQQRCLFLGVISYVAWHIMEMAARV